MTQMRSEGECLAKAAEMDAKAKDCATPEMRASYRDLAQGWRFAGRQAAWQRASFI